MKDAKRNRGYSSTVDECGAIGHVFKILKDSVATRCKYCGWERDMVIAVPRVVHPIR